ncbi:ABC-2 transporter permease [Vagococcus elongatus]|uniref:ABC-2 transporter permease n=1 Tax=Vagococcus elongatus TaxID=180344 RepID=A0A430ATZ7_9ENTE|nr:ABC-2 transporter permease [Vagococcus elongatus]RSU11532.1 hypothetical protein CBF29_07560 [Vagococcus elongatus]
MTGVMTKDLCQNLLIRKNRLSLILNFSVCVLSMLLMKNVYGLVLPAFVYIPFIISPSLLQMSSERDRISHYDKSQLAMPVTKREIIFAKYSLGVLYCLFNTAVLFVGIFIHTYIYHSITITQGLYMGGACLLLSLLSVAINYLSYIVLGDKGIFVTVGIISIMLISYFWNFSFLNFDRMLETLLNLNDYTLFSLGGLGVIAALFLSYVCATVYYSKKEIS